MVCRGEERLYSSSFFIAQGATATLHKHGRICHATPLLTKLENSTMAAKDWPVTPGQ